VSWSFVFVTLTFELVSNFLRYFLVAAAFFVVFWVWGLWPGRRIQARRPSIAHIRSEVWWSLSTVVVFSVVGLLNTAAIKAGWTRVYFGIGERGVAGFVTSLVLMVVLHDAYFYWTHRLLHHPALFERFHRIHHLSITPTPWAAYSFHPVEAVVQAGIFPLLVFLVPAHPVALFLFLLYMIVRNVLGHLGVEVFPRGFAGRRWTRLHTTTTHHDLHHRDFRGNYGLYFGWWDTLFGTEHPDYRHEFDVVTQRRRT
jgi:sterol desaturase/sphingolipid hydroxylase (fatty acid hydroxylase superfamily)